MGGFLFGELLFGELLGGELMGGGLLEGSLCLPITERTSKLGSDSAKKLSHAHDSIHASLGGHYKYEF